VKRIKESFFAIREEEIESKLHLQSPWLLRLELDRAKMIGRKLTMHYVASRTAESFKIDLFVIWSEDNSEKLVIRCRVLSWEGEIRKMMAWTQLKKISSSDSWRTRCSPPSA
jgi:hypothetical protein